MPQDGRKKACNAAKLAVNAYAKDPSDKNAARVQSAWRAVKDMQAAPFWQQQLQTWLRSDSGPDDDLKRVIQQALENAGS
jgi:DNA replication protein DnaD